MSQLIEIMTPSHDLRGMKRKENKSQTSFVFFIKKIGKPQVANRYALKCFKQFNYHNDDNLIQLIYLSYSFPMIYKVKMMWLLGFAVLN